MKEIGVIEFREILAEVIGNDYLIRKKVIHTPDDKLLKMNLYTDLGLDSLDVEDMCSKLYDKYGIIVDIYGHHPLAYYSFEHEPTVKNFIETVNDCSSR